MSVFGRWGASPQMQGMKRIGALLAGLALAVVCALAWAGAALAQGGGTSRGGRLPADPWPREVKLGDATALVYQPQVNSWEGNTLDFRSAVAVRPTSKQEILGVIWATARTQVDRISRIVALEDLTLTRSEFPTLPDRGASYMPALQKHFLPAQRTIALDRLEAALAASRAAKPRGVAVNNDPPRIIVSESPAVLVPIDGSPALRPVPGTQLERVINTRALILQPQGLSVYDLHVYDGWLFAGTIMGPWYKPPELPAGIDQVARSLARSGQVDLLDGGNVTPKPSLATGVPTIYVSEAPAELLVFKGPPSFSPIAGTSLGWAANTTADVLLDTSSGNYYVLLAGRWFRAPAMTGPWTYVASTGLPADFSRIPVGSPAGVVLAAVAGTPQAQEALIANSIPQTATVPRVKGPTFSPVFDGAPQLRPVEGTSLEYVVNSPTAIIQVSPSAYYALRAGVWFSATSLGGPWFVAARVPEVTYTIPATSPLHYVTYVRVYGSTAKVVYVGYTPGYLGTVVAPDGVVVYGTGYAYQPWIGTAWYPAPATYGVMAQPIYNPAAGRAFGFAMGVTTAAVVGSAHYHPAYYGYPCCGSTSVNVYGYWGNTVTSGTRTWYSTSSGEIGQTAGVTTPYGASGTVERSASYDATTGRYYHSSSLSATGPAGQQVTASTAAGIGPQGAAAGRQLSYTNPTTGQTQTYGAAYGGNNVYADSSGNVYRNTGTGWQQSTSSGWQGAPSEPSWAGSEQWARNQGENQFNTFSQSSGYGGYGAYGSGYSGYRGYGGYGGGYGGYSGYGGGYGSYGWGDRYGLPSVWRPRFGRVW